MPSSSGSIAYLGAARFQGFWNASSNAASGSGLSDGAQGTFTTLFQTGSSPANGHHTGSNLTASNGDYWQVTGSGTLSVDGVSAWALNDWSLYSGSVWLKMAFDDTIASIVIGDLSTSTFHMGTANDKHIIFDSGSALSGSDNYVFDYDNNILSLTGSLYQSGSGNTVSFMDNVGIATATPGDKLEVKDGRILLTDTDVVHGITNVAPTNAYGSFGAIHATYGGLMINGVSDQENAGARSLALRGISNDNHTDTVPLVEIIGAKRSGVTVQALAAAETVLQVANHTTELITVLGDGKVGIGDTTPSYTLDVNGTFSVADHAYLKDNKNLYFGTDSDAFIKYDTNVGALILSGSNDATSTKGFVVSGSSMTIATTLGLELTASAVGAGYEGTLWFGYGGSNRFMKSSTEDTVQFNAPNIDINTATDFNVDSPLVTLQSHTSTKPTVKILNSTNDANGVTLQLNAYRWTDSIQDAQDGDELGTILWTGVDDGTPSATHYARILGSIADATDASEDGKLSFKVMSSGTETELMTMMSGGVSTIHDYNTVAFESQLSDGQGVGRVLKYSPGSAVALTAGALHYLNPTGSWGEVDADTTTSGSSHLLGIAFGGNPRTAGMLIEGFARIPSTQLQGTFMTGSALYVSEDAGKFDFDAPSASGRFVRVVGHAIDWSADDALIYFNPDRTWVEIA